MFNIGGKRFDAKHSNAHTPHCKLILKTGRVIPHVAIQSRTARMKHYEKHCSVLPSEVQTGEMHYSNRGPSQSLLELAGQSRPLKAAELKFSDLKLSNCNCNFPSSIPMLGSLSSLYLYNSYILPLCTLPALSTAFALPRTYMASIVKTMLPKTNVMFPFRVSKRCELQTPKMKTEYHIC